MHWVWKALIFYIYIYFKAKLYIYEIVDSLYKGGVSMESQDIGVAVFMAALH